MIGKNCRIVRTTYKSRQNDAEREKAKARALGDHLRKLATITDDAASVRICALAPDRPWVSVQEWQNPGGTYQGQWVSDIEVT